MAITLKVIFGLDALDDCKKIAHYITDGEGAISYRSQFPWRPYTAWLTGHNQRLNSHLRDLRAWTAERMEQKKAANDLLDELIRHSEFNDGKLSLDDLRNEIIVHLAASTETVALAEAWTLYLLQQHPAYLAKIRAEVDAVTNGKELQVAHYQQLRWTKWAIQEAMRLYPPSHCLVRDALKEDVINGVKIPKGATFFYFGLWHSSAS